MRIGSFIRFGFIEISDGVVVVTLGAVGDAAAAEGCGVFRIEPVRLIVIRDVAVIVAPCAVDEAIAEGHRRGFQSSRIASS
jgi:hypothetical protein